MMLKTEPQRLTLLDEVLHKFRPTGNAWWYEENGGITVVVEPHPNTVQLRIPWKVVRASLQRKDQT